MNNQFPLFRLPDKALCVIIGSCMTIMQICALSFASKKSKEVVKNSNNKSYPLYVALSQQFEICVVVSHDVRVHWLFEMPLEEDARTLTPRRAMASTSESDEKCNWFTLDGSGIKTFIDNFKSIFKQSAVTGLFRQNSNRYPIAAIYEASGPIRTLSILSNHHEYNQDVLRHFMPTRLCTITTSLPGGEVFTKILMDNKEEWFFLNSNNFSLINLLICNSKFISFANSRFPETEINRFLKLWVKGANPALDFLRFEFARNFVVSKENILRGVRMRNAGNDVRCFKCVTGRKVSIRGGEDLYRFDGTKATFQFFNNGTNFKLNFFVWKEDRIL